MKRIVFRRATHDKITNDYLDKFHKDNLSVFQEMVWKAHGDICHILHSGRGVTYEKILEEIRRDETNYDYHPNDLESGRWCGGNMPSPEQVALSLVRLIEAGFVEIEPLDDSK